MTVAFGIEGQDRMFSFSTHFHENLVYTNIFVNLSFTTKSEYKLNIKIIEKDSLR